jgi:endoglucanase
MKLSLFGIPALGLSVFQSSSVLGAATKTATADVTCSGATKFEYFGVNESGAEFGNTVIPGTLGTDYIWPAPSSIDVSTYTLSSPFFPMK